MGAPHMRCTLFVSPPPYFYGFDVEKTTSKVVITK
jgi:hypothetical protein